MVSQLLLAWCLMSSNVVIHAFGVTSALRWLRGQQFTSWQPASSIRTFVRLAAWIVLLHVTEITVWALSYSALRAFPELQSALYFSGVTYTTTGYGDLVLPQRWRMVGAVEALTGILMCGWSTAFFFEIVHRVSVRRGGMPNEQAVEVKSTAE
jgi:voltage-gated potassium channel Kch